MKDALGFRVMLTCVAEEGPDAVGAAPAEEAEEEAAAEADVVAAAGTVVPADAEAQVAIAVCAVRLMLRCPYCSPPLAPVHQQSLETRLIPSMAGSELNLDSSTEIGTPTSQLHTRCSTWCGRILIGTTSDSVTGVTGGHRTKFRVKGWSRLGWSLFSNLHCCSVVGRRAAAVWMARVRGPDQSG